MRSAWRSIDNGPAEAAWNMAADEAILLSNLDGKSSPTIRFFQWKVPSITFGYMLNVRDELNVELCRERRIPLIRRITGGGVVFHGCDITFSVIFPTDLAQSTSSALDSYRFINEILLRSFSSLGIEASLLYRTDKEKSASSESHNVCFVEPTTYDVLHNGKKLVGNAQRRRKGWVLNHGSMLYDASYRDMLDLLPDQGAAQLFTRSCVPLKEIITDIKREDVIASITKQLSKDLKVIVQPEELSEEEIRRAQDLANTKYSTDEWNIKRRTS
jgi:lipoate-protein ligase A